MPGFNFEECFVEIRFPKIGTQVVDNFLKVKETLTRIGIPSVHGDSKTLYQSCHILYKRQRYWLVHFLEMFLLDGKFQQTNLTDEDLARRNAIALLLEDWGLVEIVNPEKCETPPPSMAGTFKVLPFKDKKLWTLQPKYTIGGHKQITTTRPTSRR